jgi:hypothetical protein
MEKKTGCSIMSDGWTEKKRHCICNFLVNGPKGTIFFLSSVDTSNMSKTADKVFEMLDVILERIGKENIVQVVTRLVDSDEKPAMSFIYKTMDQAKEKIQVNFGSVKKKVYILLIVYFKCCHLLI